MSNNILWTQDQCQAKQADCTIGPTGAEIVGSPRSCYDFTFNLMLHTTCEMIHYASMIQKRGLRAVFFMPASRLCKSSPSLEQ